MKIAFTTSGKDISSKIDARFGRTDYIQILDENMQVIEILDNTSIAQEAHGAGPKTAQKLYKLKADILITGNGPGGNALSVIQRGETKIYIGAADLTVEEAYFAYKENKLSLM